MKIVIVVSIAAFMLFFVATSPADAAKITHAAWHGVVHTSHGVASFITKL